MSQSLAHSSVSSAYLTVTVFSSVSPPAAQSSLPPEWGTQTPGGGFSVAETSWYNCIMIICIISNVAAWNLPHMMVFFSQSRGFSWGNRPSSPWESGPTIDFCQYFTVKYFIANLSSILSHFSFQTSCLIIFLIVVSFWVSLHTETPTSIRIIKGNETWDVNVSRVCNLSGHFFYLIEELFSLIFGLHFRGLKKIQQCSC